MTTGAVNAIVRETLVPGPGMFTRLLLRELDRRAVDVPYVAHDLPGELDGLPSPIGSTLRRAARGN